jgi:hypothetical protein
VPVDSDTVAAYAPLGLFGPPGGARLHCTTFPPAGTRVGTAGLDLGTGGGLEMHPTAPEGMHRSETVDFNIVIDGEITMSYPGGDDAFVTIRKGEVIVVNGTFHRWENRTDKPCTMIAIVLPAAGARD